MQPFFMKKATIGTHGEDIFIEKKYIQKTIIAL
jgi:hypothetical protein